jgi:hypothetical protein
MSVYDNFPVCVKLRLKLSMFIQEVSKFYGVKSISYSRNSPSFMKTEGLLLCSQETAMCLSWARWIQSTPLLCTSFKPVLILRSAFFWDFTQRTMAVNCRRFGTDCQPQIYYLALENWTIGCTEMWLRNCHCALHKIPKERSSLLHCGKSLKSRNFNIPSFTSRSSKWPLSFTLRTPPIKTLISSSYCMARCSTHYSPQCVIFFIFQLPPTS